jgi:hypothetical protein
MSVRRSSRLIALALIVLGSTPGGADTLRVPSVYPTIQSALDAASVLDTVLVAPGAYADTLTVTVDGVPKVVNAHVTRQVYLFAENPAATTHIDGSASDIAIYVDNTSCEIRGFEVTTTFAVFGCVLARSAEAPLQLSDDVGIRCDNGYVGLSDCDIHDHNRGVEMNSADALIERCEVYRCYIGVISENSPLTTITDNHFYTAGGMVEAYYSAVHIDCNRFDYQGDFGCTAIRLFESEGTIVDNVVESIIVDGIVIFRSTVLIESNTIATCQLGLVMTFADSSIVRQNIFRRNINGIDVRATVGATIENNTFAEGGTGIICQSETTDPVIQKNIIYNHNIGIVCLFDTFPTIGCNDIYNTPDRYFEGCPDLTGVGGNFSVEAQFCAPADLDFGLQPDSPCAPGNHPQGADCGLIGAFGVTCTDVEVKSTSWGRLKSRYRNTDGQ